MTQTTTPIIQAGVPITNESVQAKLGAGATGLYQGYFKLADLADWSAAYTAEDLAAPTEQGGLGMPLDVANVLKSAMVSEVPQLKTLIDGLQWLSQCRGA